MKVSASIFYFIIFCYSNSAFVDFSLKKQNEERIKRNICSFAAGVSSKIILTPREIGMFRNLLHYYPSYLEQCDQEGISKICNNFGSFFNCNLNKPVQEEKAANIPLIDIPSNSITLPKYANDTYSFIKSCQNSPICENSFDPNQSYNPLQNIQDYYSYQFINSNPAGQVLIDQSQKPLLQNQKNLAASNPLINNNNFVNSCVMVPNSPECGNKIKSMEIKSGLNRDCLYGEDNNNCIVAKDQQNASIPNNQKDYYSNQQPFNDQIIFRNSFQIPAPVSKMDIIKKIPTKSQPKIVSKDVATVHPTVFVPIPSSQESAIKIEENNVSAKNTVTTSKPLINSIQKINCSNNSKTAQNNINLINENPEICLKEVQVNNILNNDLSTDIAHINSDQNLLLANKKLEIKNEIANQEAADSLKHLISNFMMILNHKSKKKKNKKNRKAKKRKDRRKPVKTVTKQIIIEPTGFAPTIENEMNNQWQAPKHISIRGRRLLCKKNQKNCYNKNYNSFVEYQNSTRPKVKTVTQTILETKTVTSSNSNNNFEKSGLVEFQDAKNDKKEILNKEMNLNENNSSNEKIKPAQAANYIIPQDSSQKEMNSNQNKSSNEETKPAQAANYFIPQDSSHIIYLENQKNSLMSELIKTLKGLIDDDQLVNNNISKTKDFNESKGFNLIRNRNKESMLVSAESQEEETNDADDKKKELLEKIKNIISQKDMNEDEIKLLILEVNKLKEIEGSKKKDKKIGTVEIKVENIPPKISTSTKIPFMASILGYRPSTVTVTKIMNMDERIENTINEIEKFKKKIQEKENELKKMNKEHSDALRLQIKYLKNKEKTKNQENEAEAKDLDYNSKNKKKKQSKFLSSILNVFNANKIEKIATSTDSVELIVKTITKSVKKKDNNTKSASKAYSTEEKKTLSSIKSNYKNFDNSSSNSKIEASSTLSSSESLKNSTINSTVPSVIPSKATVLESVLTSKNSSIGQAAVSTISMISENQSKIPSIKSKITQTLNSQTKADPIQQTITKTITIDAKPTTKTVTQIKSVNNKRRIKKAEIKLEDRSTGTPRVIDISLPVEEFEKFVDEANYDTENKDNKK